MLRLLGRATSGNVQKVLFLLEELGLDYQRVDYGRQFNNTDTTEYLAMNPTGKVPTLIDRDLVIWESNTILRYLADQADSEFYPKDPARRSHVERWMDWTLASLNGPYLAGFRYAKDPRPEHAAGVRDGLSSQLQLLDRHLAGDGWVAGGAISIADTCLGPIVHRCLEFPLELPDLPAIGRWHRRLRERPAFYAAIAAG